MSATVIKFEVYANTQQRGDLAWSTFKSALSGLASGLFYYQVYTIDSTGNESGQGLIIHGLLPTANGAAALTQLNTLNGALTVASLGTVSCVTYNVVTQP